MINGRRAGALADDRVTEQLVQCRLIKSGCLAEAILQLELPNRLLGLRTDNAVDLPMVETLVLRLLLSLPNLRARYVHSGPRVGRGSRYCRHVRAGIGCRAEGVR